MLAVESIETAYGVSQVLFGVSFRVDAGQVVTLLGRNGMGKTTTIRSIMGIVPPRAGTISFEGRAIQGLPPYRVAQTGLGLVPEGRQVFPNLTVRENLVATAGNRIGSQAPWRVETVFDSAIEARGFDKMRSIVEVDLVGGRKLLQPSDERYRGSPENPFTRADLHAKFSDCASLVLSPAKIARALEAIESVERLANIRELAAALTA